MTVETSLLARARDACSGCHRESCLGGHGQRLLCHDVSRLLRLLCNDWWSRLQAQRRGRLLWL